MDLWGRSGKRDYPAAEFLAAWVTADKVWPHFDGWCASRNVDSLALPWDRWLNLVYHFATRNSDKEERDKFDQAIADYVSAWYLAKAKPTIAVAKAEAEAQPKNARPERKRAPRPAWYGDDKGNTFNAKAAMTTLTAPGVSGKRSRR